MPPSQDTTSSARSARRQKQQDVARFDHRLAQGFRDAPPLPGDAHQRRVLPPGEAHGSTVLPAMRAPSGTTASTSVTPSPTAPAPLAALGVRGLRRAEFIERRGVGLDHQHVAGGEFQVAPGAETPPPVAHDADQGHVRLGRVGLQIAQPRVDQLSVLGHAQLGDVGLERVQGSPPTPLSRPGISRQPTAPRRSARASAARAPTGAKSNMPKGSPRASPGTSR
jgi:hypothetical protein